MGRKFVIGDIHGAHIPLKQCLERSGFDKENDLLITLGDICDGWPYVYECVEELLTIKDRIDLVGNHDEWFGCFLKTGLHPDNWRQGGKGTAVSYLRNCTKPEDLYDGGNLFRIQPKDIPASHRQFFEKQSLYYKDDENRLFIHAGFNRHESLSEIKSYNPESFFWDRKLWGEALGSKGLQKLKYKERFSEIFIGHTETTNWTTREIKTINGIVLPYGEPITEPMFADILINVDTGAGSRGKLTIMDIDTKKYWQSDPVNDIYGPYKPRG